jgi:hypothetical protein
MQSTSKRSKHNLDVLSRGRIQTFSRLSDVNISFTDKLKRQSSLGNSSSGKPSPRQAGNTFGGNAPTLLLSQSPNALA